MARTRKSSKTNEEVVRRTIDGLKHPYPARPGQGRYVIYCDTQKQDEQYPRVLVLIFAEAYAAARLVKILIGKDELEACALGSRAGVLTSSGIRITAFPENMILDLIEYDPTSEEAEWRDQDMEQSAMRLKLGTRWEVTKDEVEEEEVIDDATGEVVTRKVKGKKGKTPRVKKEKAPRIDRTGMVTATDLAARLKIEPRIFRGALRALKKVKPTGGWLWSKDDAEAIFKEVTKQLEKDGKVKKGKKK